MGDFGRVADLRLRPMFAPSFPALLQCVLHNAKIELVNFWDHKNVPVMWMLRLEVCLVRLPFARL